MKTTNTRKQKDGDNDPIFDNRIKTIKFPNEQSTNVAETTDSEIMRDDGKVEIPDVEIKYDSSHKFDGVKQIDRKHVTIPMGAVNNTNGGLHRKNCRFVEAFKVEKKLRTMSVSSHITESLDAIVGYAEEPLLSLAEACVPLASIIDDVLVYVQLALRDTPEKPPDELTINESASIRLYTMEWELSHRSLYTLLNQAFKNADREALRPYFKYLKLFLTALVKLPCVPPQTVWRGVTKDLSKEFPPGTSVTWWSFSSCTTSLPVLASNIYLGNVGERTLFSVEAINGRIIRAHSQISDEDEILLLPGTYMEVQSQLSPAPDLHIIHLKQMKPNKTLLELPFAGAHLYQAEKKEKPWYMKKRTIAELSLFVILCLAGIIVGIIFGTRRPPPSPVCYPRKAGIRADLLWSFDCGDAREDLKGLDNGTNVNGITYSSPDFSGLGEALNMDRSRSQYVRLPRSLNLTMNTSFTVGVWVFYTVSNWQTILSDCNEFKPICIGFAIQNIFIYTIVYNWTDGSILQIPSANVWDVICQSCWIHLAFSFDNQQNLLCIYFNGILKSTTAFSLSQYATTPRNESKISYIGLSSVINHSDAFSGLIDQLSISYYVKNASEILDEATLLCSYKFDTDNVNVDSGPNNIPATNQNVSRLSSNNQSTLLFNSNNAYFQSSNFTLLMSNTYQFSFAFWFRPFIVKPDKLNSAMAILQLVSKVQQISSESYACFLTLYLTGLDTATPVFGFAYPQLNMLVSLRGHTVQNNTWTYIAVTFLDGHQMTFYSNSFRSSGNDSRFSLFFYNPRLSVTIGGAYFDDTVTIKPQNYETMQCFAENPPFNYTQLYGEIDDFKFLARAITDSDYLAFRDSTAK